MLAAPKVWAKGAGVGGGLGGGGRVQFREEVKLQRKEEKKGTGEQKSLLNYKNMVTKYQKTRSRRKRKHRHIVGGGLLVGRGVKRNRGGGGGEKKHHQQQPQPQQQQQQHAQGQEYTPSSDNSTGTRT